MAASVNTPLKATKWKQWLHYEVTTSWTSEEQGKVLLTMSELLSEGFSLPQIMTCLMAIYPKHLSTFQAMMARLAMGDPFYATVVLMKIPPNVQYQLRVAESGGDFNAGVDHVARYLKMKAKQKKQLQQTLMYPCFLCVLVIGLLFGLRAFLLPQLKRMSSTENRSAFLGGLFWGLEHLPVLLLGALILLVGSLWIFHIYKKRTSPLKWRQYFTRWPIMGRFFRQYQTYYFAYEFSQLFALGYSVKQIIAEFSSQDQVPFLQEFGEFLGARYAQGISFAMSLTEAGLFTVEFPAIVQHGEQINALAVKMRVYSQHCHKQLMYDVQQAIHWLQNLLFVFIALIVVLVYLMLMLPMFSMIGGLES
ncbi:MAG: competence type IV pilus assembly protein ComGB [Aerococcus sp.]|nr:competence type IV pilus assembly protein ComGB [Aerococcus sp.]